MPGYHAATLSPIDLVGDVTWDIHLAIPHLPTPAKEARATNRTRRLGGTASHVARWLHLLAQTGLYPAEPPGIRLWAVLDAQAARALSFCDTSSCPIVPQIGEVYTLTLPDTEKALLSFFPPDLPPRPLPTQSSLLYLSAYALLTPDAGQHILTSCERLIAEGAQLVFDLAPLAQHIERKLLQRLIGLARIALGNEEEWHTVFKTTSGEEGARAAIEHGAGCVHLKRGAQGALLFCADGTSTAVAPAPCQPINTTGAGDAYTAATLAALAAGRDDHWAIRLATFCGALQTEQRLDPENIARLRAFLTAWRA